MNKTETLHILLRSLAIMVRKVQSFGAGAEPKVSDKDHRHLVKSCHEPLDGILPHFKTCSGYATTRKVNKWNCV